MKQKLLNSMHSIYMYLSYLFELLRQKIYIMSQYFDKGLVYVQDFLPKLLIYLQTIYSFVIFKLMPPILDVFAFGLSGSFYVVKNLFSISFGLLTFAVFVAFSLSVTYFFASDKINQLFEKYNQNKILNQVVKSVKEDKDVVCKISKNNDSLASKIFSPKNDKDVDFIVNNSPNNLGKQDNFYPELNSNNINAIKNSHIQNILCSSNSIEESGKLSQIIANNLDKKVVINFNLMQLLNKESDALIAIDKIIDFGPLDEANKRIKDIKIFVLDNIRKFNNFVGHAEKTFSTDPKDNAQIVKEKYYAIKIKQYFEKFSRCIFALNEKLNNDNKFGDTKIIINFLHFDNFYRDLSTKESISFLSEFLSSCQNKKNIINIINSQELSKKLDGSLLTKKPSIVEQGLDLIKPITSDNAHPLDSLKPISTALAIGGVMALATSSFFASLFMFGGVFASRFGYSLRPRNGENKNLSERIIKEVDSLDGKPVMVAQEIESINKFCQLNIKFEKVNINTLVSCVKQVLLENNIQFNQDMQQNLQNEITKLCFVKNIIKDTEESVFDRNDLRTILISSGFQDKIDQKKKHDLESKPQTWFQYFSSFIYKPANQNLPSKI